LPEKSTAKRTGASLAGLSRFGVSPHTLWDSSHGDAGSAQEGAV